MMPTVQDDVRTLVEAVEVAPAVPEHQRSAVRGLAGELISESSCINGLDLSVFAEIGLQLALSCARPDTPARTCSADNSAWFDEVGIRDRECRNEARETDHFEQVKQVGQHIGQCTSAIETIVRSADMAIRAILEPARQVFEIAQRCGITQLVEIAVDVIIEALRCATATTSDRNGVIAQCLDSIAECTGEAAQMQPAPVVEKQHGSVTSAASAGSAGSVAGSSIGTVTAGLNVSVDVGLNLGLELDLAGEHASATECSQEEAPTPEPEAPTPPPPPPAPTPTQTGDGVIAPPAELSQVEEPAPPPKKMQNLDTTAASIGGTDSAAAGNDGGQDPWAMKKSGEW